jgi:predicted N-acetyltransferase YhbS
MPASRVLGIVLRFVPAKDAELELIAGIVNRAFHTHPLMNGGNRTSPDNLIQESGAEGGFILASIEGQVVATAMVRPVNALDGAPGYTPTPEALYFGLAGVERTRMRSGLGAKLVGEAERIARERGLTHVALNTLHEFDLVPYYARKGYIVLNDEPFEAGHWGLGAPHTVCHMEKPL